MSDERTVTPDARDAAWEDYASRLGNKTEREESALRHAFRAGWRAAGEEQKNENDII